VFSSYYSQDVADQLDKDQTILETLEGMNSELSQNQLRTLLGSFLFRGDDIFKKIIVLSGGEKSRVALAKILLTKSNFIILDEPTNHLDMTSSQLLQSALVNFSGSLIIVSHDIDFLRPIVNKVMDIRDGSVVLYEGDIDYYLWKKNEQKKSSLFKNVKNESNSGKSLSNKELKKKEAEKRQLKYRATKKLSEEVKYLEKRIKEFETKIEELEKILFDPILYNDHEKVNKINLDYNKNKEELDKLLLIWDKKLEELKAIENKFI